MKLCLQITADTSNISKNVQRNIGIIFNALADAFDGFVKFCLFFQIKNVASFTKTRFYWKRDFMIFTENWLKMLNFAEAFWWRGR